MQRKGTQLLAIALAALIIALGARQLGWLEPLENALWDTRVSLLADPAKHDPNIKIILIDQSSLDWAEESNRLSWPWPREMYTAITDFCVNGGAKAVIFDMLFTEASLYGSGDDARFAASLAKAPSVGAVVLSDTQGTQLTWPKGVNNRVNSALSVTTKSESSRAAFPVDVLARSFTALGSVVATPDSDGILRRVRLMSGFEGRALPTLALAAHLATEESSGYRLDAGRFCLGVACTPLDSDGNAVINFRGPSQTYDAFNAAAIIQSKLLRDAGESGSVDPESFRGSYVFVGVSAPGLMDLKSTPIQGVYPGVEVHATVLDNLRHGDFVAMVPFAPMFALMLLLTLAVTAGIRYGASLLYTALYPVTALALLAAAGTLAYRYNFWLELAPALVALVLAGLAAFGLNYLIEGRQRRFIRSAFAQYLSPQVIETLIAQPETLKLGGKRETLTLFFSDIEGFTTISTQMDAERVAQFLNDYLGLLSDAIMALGGTIDKYEGDAIIAFWNAPLPQREHAELAVTAALKCQQLLEARNPYYLETYGHAVKTRFGIHTGEVIIGNLGTEKRFDYTFIGDAGNLAARLESANKQFGSYVMISETTRAALPDTFYCRTLGTIAVVGRAEPIRVYEPMEVTKAQARMEGLQGFETALTLLEDGDTAAARAAFEALGNADPVSRRYAQIAEAVETGRMRLEHGVLILSEK